MRPTKARKKSTNRSKPITCNVTPATYKKLVAKAAKADRSVSAYVRIMVEEDVN